MQKRRRTDPYRVPALDKALDILEHLAVAGPASMQGIADMLGRSKTEIYRLLLRLEARGYLEKSRSDGSYSLTNGLFDLAMRHGPMHSLEGAARPVMEELAERTLQSCHLTVVSGDHIVCIARQESPAAIGFSVQVGFRAPILQTTSGRVFFANQDRGRQALLVRRLRRSGQDPSQIRKVLLDTPASARRGYLVERSRLTEGIRDISAPIFGPDAHAAVACLTIPYISHLHFPMSLEETIPRLLQAVQEITCRLRLGVSEPAPKGGTE